jgi:cysteine desulfurase
MAKTIRLAFEQAKLKHAHVLEIKNTLMDAFKSMESIVINSPLEGCSDYILNISCLKVPSQIMLNWLSAHQIYVSAMATCLNRDVRPSHVLEAMGFTGNRLNGVIRIRIAYTNTLDDAKRLIEVMEEGIKKYGRI